MSPANSRYPVPVTRVEAKPRRLADGDPQASGPEGAADAIVVFSVQALFALLSSLALIACGGGSSEAPASPSTLLELTAASPSGHNGRTVDGPHSAKTLEYRGPDGLSAQPYCHLRVAGLEHSGGGIYDASVAFEAAGQRVIAVTISTRSASWHVSAVNPPSRFVHVDFARRAVLLNAMEGVAVGDPKLAANVSGELTFPAGAAASTCF